MHDEFINNYVLIVVAFFLRVKAIAKNIGASSF